MNVAIQRIRDYLLSEECQLSERELMDPGQNTLDSPKKKVTIRGTVHRMGTLSRYKIEFVV